MCVCVCVCVWLLCDSSSEADLNAKESGGMQGPSLLQGSRQEGEGLLMPLQGGRDLHQQHPTGPMAACAPLQACLCQLQRLSQPSGFCLNTNSFVKLTMSRLPYNRTRVCFRADLATRQTANGVWGSNAEKDREASRHLVKLQLEQQRSRAA